MKKTGRIICLCLVLSVLVTGHAFSQTNKNLSDLGPLVESFSGQIAQSLAFNSTMGLNWSDAHIGQFPRFGVGVSMGFTAMDLGAMNQVLGMFDGRSLPGNVDFGLLLPVYTLEGRIGGFFMPFDIGVKFGYLPEDTSIFGMTLDYLLVGADIRFSLLPRVLPLRLSVGFGFNHLRGGISTTIPMGQEFSFGPEESRHTLRIEDPAMGLLWNTTTYELKAQASFRLLVVTPYAGIGVSHARSEAGYQVRTRLTIIRDDTGTEVTDLDEVAHLLNAAGVTNVSLDEGFGRMIPNTAWNVRVYGGVSFNLAVIRIDLTAMYNISTSALGASLGLRFQM